MAKKKMHDHPNVAVVGRFRMLSIAEMITRASPSMPSVFTLAGAPGPDAAAPDAGGPPTWPRCSGPRQR